MACCTSSSTPSFLAAEMGMTGMPSISSMAFTSIKPWFPITSSIMFRASTMGTSISSSCIVRYRLRWMLVASTMLMMARGFSSSTKFRETISSLL